jgi:hypothetical protein
MTLHHLFNEIKASTSSIIFLLYGTHGNEIDGSFYIADSLAVKLNLLFPDSQVKLIGPISPWSCRNRYRYDRGFGDPNRYSNPLAPSTINHDLNHWSKCWNTKKPSDYGKIIDFLSLMYNSGVNPQLIFQAAQTSHPGCPGYVNQALQIKRVNYLNSSILKLVDGLPFSKIFLLDIHTGVGLDATTEVFYDTHDNNGEIKYLVDILCFLLSQNLNKKVQGFILETGIINNTIGIIDCLSEIAARTFGYTDNRYLLYSSITNSWRYRVHSFIQEF